MGEDAAWFPRASGNVGETKLGLLSLSSGAGVGGTGSESGGGSNPTCNVSEAWLSVLGSLSDLGTPGTFNSAGVMGGLMGSPITSQCMSLMGVAGFPQPFCGSSAMLLVCVPETL